MRLTTSVWCPINKHPITKEHQATAVVRPPRVTKVISGIIVTAYKFWRKCGRIRAAAGPIHQAITVYTL